MRTIATFCQRRGLALIPMALILFSCAVWTEMEILVPSLPEMKRFFSVNDAQIQQLLTVNFIGFFFGVILAGPLCDSLGRKTLLVWGGIFYIVCCIGCVIAGDFTMLLCARFLQGFVMTGPLLAVGVLLYEHTSGEKQLFWMAMANASVTFCMAAAPIIGSFLTSTWGFRANLWFVVGCGVVGIIPAIAVVPETLAHDTRQALNLPQLTKGYFQLCRDWRFMSLTLPICFLAASYWIYVGISALYLVDHLGVPAAEFGRYQGPIVGCFSLVSLGSGRLLQRFGLVCCVIIGIIAMTIGMGSLYILNSCGYENAFMTTVCMMLFAGGMAPICSLLFPHSMQHLRQELQGKAQALVQAFRLLFASTGTAVLGVFYHGPFLPVASLLMLSLLISGVLLWSARGFLVARHDELPAVTLAH